MLKGVRVNIVAPDRPPPLNVCLPSECDRTSCGGVWMVSVRCILSRFAPPRSSHERVAGQVGDATQVTAVTSHQDVPLVAPRCVPAVQGTEKKSVKGEGEGGGGGGLVCPAPSRLTCSSRSSTAAPCWSRRSPPTARRG